MTDYARWNRTITDAAGNIVNATVHVYRESDGLHATIYSDRTGATPKDNPFTLSNSDYGLAFFHAAGGAYKIVATRGSYSQTWRWEAVGTAAEYDVGAFVAAGQAAATALTRTALKALSTATYKIAYLSESGREGMFEFMSGNYASLVTADTQEGIYIKADDTSTSSGAWVRVFTSIIRPEWYGAVGDGSTDDYTALQAALTFALSSGFELHLGPVSYKTGTQLNIGSVTGVTSGKRLVIRGDGRTKSIIKGAVSSDILRIGDPAATAFTGYVVLEDFGIEPFSGSSPTSALATYDMVRSTIRRVRFYGCGHGVYQSGGVTILYDDCDFDGNTNGITTDDFSSLAGGGEPNFTRIVNSRIINNTAKGVNFTGGRMMVIDNCDIEGNGTLPNANNAGIYEASDIGSVGALSNAFGLKVTGCWFEGNAYAASVVLLSGSNSIRDCYFVNNPDASYDIYIGGTASYHIDLTQHDTGKTYHIVDEGTTSAKNSIVNARQADGSLANISIVTTPSRTKIDYLGADGLDTDGTLSGNNDLKVPSQKAVKTYVDAATREKLSASRTYYVRSDGSDANTGLANTSGGAFATIAKALTTAAALDCATYDVTIQIGAGTWTTAVSLPQMLGSGTFTLLGDAATPANVIISTTSATAVSLSGKGNWTVNGFKLQTTTSGYGLKCDGEGILKFLNINFGACVTGHMASIGNLAQLIATGNYSVSGGGSFHLVAQAGGYVYVGGATMTLLASVTLSWVFAAQAGVIAAALQTFTLGAFSVTGTRYNLSGNSVCDTNSGGVNYFPGSVAGSTATGAQYI